MNIGLEVQVWNSGLGIQVQEYRFRNKGLGIKVFEYMLSNTGLGIREYRIRDIGLGIQS